MSDGAKVRSTWWATSLPNVAYKQFWRKKLRARTRIFRKTVLPTPVSCRSPSTVFVIASSRIEVRKRFVNPSPQNRMPASIDLIQAART